MSKPAPARPRPGVRFAARLAAAATLGLAVASHAVALDQPAMPAIVMHPAAKDVPGSERYIGSPEQQRAADELAAKTDTDRLMTWLGMLPTSRAAKGGEASRAGLRATEDLLERELRKMGLEPVRHEFVWRPFGRRMQPESDEVGPWNNIIVELPGTIARQRKAGADTADGAKPAPEPVIIISGHFDAVRGSPGADDDGTGTVAILELARLLKDVEHERTIRLCLFNLEEVGLVGGTAYAADVREEMLAGDIEVLGMISLDMLGYFSSEPNSQRMPVDVEIPGLVKPTVADFIGIGSTLGSRPFIRSFDEAMRRSSPGLKTYVLDIFPFAPPDLLRSDHAPFLAMGIPAAIMSDTAEFRSRHYHRSTDTIETIDRERFGQVVRGIVGAAYEAARPVVDTPSASDDDKSGE